MGYFLLWIEHLALGCVLLGLGIAIGTRLRRPRLSRLVPWVSLGLLASYFLLLAIIGWSLGTARITDGLKWPILLMSISFFVISILITKSGLRRDEDGRTARAWPIKPLALGLFAIGVVHFITFWNLDMAVRQEMQQIRVEAGSVANALAPPRLHDRQNAALLYAEAFGNEDDLQRFPDEYDGWLEACSERIEEFDPHDPVFVAFIQSHAPALKIVREASQLPGCSFQRDWSHPSFHMLLPEFSAIRRAARVLVLEAHFLAASGDTKQAFENVAAIYRMAEHVGDEPLLVSMLVACAFDGVATELLENLLNHYPITVGDLEPLRQWYPRSTTMRLQRAIKMEETFAIGSMCAVTDIGVLLNMEADGTSVWPLAVNPIYRVFVFREDLAKYREFIDRYHSVSMNSYYTVHEHWDSLEHESAFESFGLFAKMLLPAVKSGHLANTRASAHRRLGRLAVELYHFKLASGKYPASFDALPAAAGGFVTLDPFSKNSLIMKTTDDKLLLYSVGADLEDDGGKVNPKAPTDGDFVFELRLEPVK